MLLPETLRTGGLPSLPAYLRTLEPALVGYVLAFFVIASWWNVHHRLFSSIVRYDPTLVRLNSFFLLMISVTPFLVSVLFAYSPGNFGMGSLSARLAVALYGVVQALGGLVLLGIWRHASRDHRLLRRTVTQEWIQATEATQLLTVIVFAGSVGIALVSPLAAELAWIAMILGFGRRFLRRVPKVARRTEAHRPP